MKLDRLPNESDKEYCLRICGVKDIYDLTWGEIADYLNEKLNYNYSSDKYRKDYYKHISAISEPPKFIEEEQQTMFDEFDATLLDIKKEKVKLQEERTQINSLVRTLAREETLKEIAKEVADTISSKKMLYEVGKPNIGLYKQSGILVISDWHYGITIDTYYNKYDPDIAKERIGYLLAECIKIIKNEKLKELVILNLGDMISGIIHLPIRINSRLDVISQTIEISEILAEFINELSKYCYIRYGSVTDNHSRIDPNKKEALQPESFVRVIDWYLESRLKNNKNVSFIINKFGPDICSFEIAGYKILGVHGDKDPQKRILTQLTTFTQEHYDVIFSAHRHHFYADEHNETELFSNGSLMGTDDYASSLRCNNKPSQLLIVCDEGNVTKKIYKIKL